MWSAAFEWFDLSSGHGRVPLKVTIRLQANNQQVLSLQNFNHALVQRRSGIFECESAANVPRLLTQAPEGRRTGRATRTRPDRPEERPDHCKADRSPRCGSGRE